MMRNPQYSIEQINNYRIPFNMQIIHEEKDDFISKYILNHYFLIRFFQFYTRACLKNTFR